MAATRASEAPHRAHLQASTTVSHILSAVSGVIGRKSLATSLHASSEGRLLSASAARSCLFVSGAVFTASATAAFLTSSLRTCLANSPPMYWRGASRHRRAHTGFIADCFHVGADSEIMYGAGAAWRFSVGACGVENLDRRLRLLQPRLGRVARCRGRRQTPGDLGGRAASPEGFGTVEDPYPLCPQPGRIHRRSGHHVRDGFAGERSC